MRQDGSGNSRNTETLRQTINKWTALASTKAHAAPLKCRARATQTHTQWVAWECNFWNKSNTKYVASQPPSATTTAAEGKFHRRRTSKCSLTKPQDSSSSVCLFLLFGAAGEIAWNKHTNNVVLFCETPNWICYTCYCVRETLSVKRQ